MDAGVGGGGWRRRAYRAAAAAGRTGIGIQLRSGVAKGADPAGGEGGKLAEEREGLCLNRRPRARAARVREE